MQIKLSQLLREDSAQRQSGGWKGGVSAGKGTQAVLAGSLVVTGGIGQVPEGAVWLQECYFCVQRENNFYHV